MCATEVPLLKSKLDFRFRLVVHFEGLIKQAFSGPVYMILPMREISPSLAADGKKFVVSSLSIHQVLSCLDVFILPPSLLARIIFFKHSHIVTMLQVA